MTAEGAMVLQLPHCKLAHIQIDTIHGKKQIGRPILLNVHGLNISPHLP